MVNAALQELRKQWLKATQTNVGTRLGYRTRKDGQTIGLLHPSGQGEWKPFTCLNSLRDVEPSIHLILDERSLGDSEEYSGHVEDVGGVTNVLSVEHESSRLRTCMWYKSITGTIERENDCGNKCDEEKVSRR